MYREHKTPPLMMTTRVSERTEHRFKKLKTNTTVTIAKNDLSQAIAARLAQSVERQAFNLVVRGSSPRSGAHFCYRFSVLIFESFFGFEKMKGYIN